MEFRDIKEDEKIGRGEYLLHKPTGHLVLVTKFDNENQTVRAMINGRLSVDSILNFQRVELSQKENKEWRKTTCGGCKMKL